MAAKSGAESMQVEWNVWYKVVVVVVLLRAKLEDDDRTHCE